MKYRQFGNTSWPVSEVGYGMWGMAGWTGSDDQQSENSLDLAVELGCNFFDTAWGYGEGKSEQLLGGLVQRHPGQKLYLATKVPPKNRTWPSQRSFTLDEVFPYEYILEYAEKSLMNLGVETIDLLQFHVWEDHWAKRDEWKRAVEDLKSSGKVQAFGISINRWEPNNSLETLKTGLIDGVQVIYNIFDQAPEDQLFPLCEELGIGVIARVPFDEGTLTGNITKETTFPEGDWRSTYFVPENLNSSVEHAEAVQATLPDGASLAEVALKFILHHPAVSTVIPGMRKAAHVRANLGCSGSTPLPEALLSELKNHRWDREPTEWSQ
jgi:aryl-alcohol dehydrogenase-like predicted oxidoreductase